MMKKRFILPAFFIAGFAVSVAGAILMANHLFGKVVSNFHLILEIFFLVLGTMFFLFLAFAFFVYFMDEINRGKKRTKPMPRFDEVLDSYVAGRQPRLSRNILTDYNLN